MKPTAVLILTHRGSDGIPLLPHLESLSRSNPEVRTHVIISEETGASSEELWRNGDRPLVAWWAVNGSGVSAEVIAVIEYDTLVEIQMPDLDDLLDLAAASVNISRQVFGIGDVVVPEHLRYLRPKADIVRSKAADLLNLPEGAPLVHAGSLGFMLFRRFVLDAISDPRWSSAYAQDLQNELRTPTIAAACGARYGVVPLPGVRFSGAPEVGAPGIYHPVKEPVVRT